METRIISLIIIPLFQQVCCQFSCSLRPDGVCKPCDCIPECFDLSDEINCPNSSSIQNVLHPRYYTADHPDNDIKSTMKFFPPPPLPPFRLCEKIAATTSTTTYKPTLTPIPVTKQTSQTLITKPHFNTTWLTSAPKTTDGSSRIFTIAPPTRGWITQQTTLPRLICSYLMQEYYSRCIRYTTRFDHYCIYVVRALRMCRRKNGVAKTTPTTTTTPRPTTTSTHRPTYRTTNTHFDHNTAPFDYYDTNYNTYYYNYG